MRPKHGTNVLFFSNALTQPVLNFQYYLNNYTHCLFFTAYKSQPTSPSQSTNADIICDDCYVYLDRKVAKEFCRLIHHSTAITRRPRLVYCVVCQTLPLTKVRRATYCNTCYSAYLTYTSRFTHEQLEEFYDNTRLPGIIDSEDILEDLYIYPSSDSDSNLNEDMDLDFGILQL